MNTSSDWIKGELTPEKQVINTAGLLWSAWMGGNWQDTVHWFHELGLTLDAYHNERTRKH